MRPDFFCSWGFPARSLCAWCDATANDKAALGLHLTLSVSTSFTNARTSALCPMRCVRGVISNLGHATSKKL